MHIAITHNIMQNRQLRIVSVCRSLPSPGNPSSGIFVLNRVAAMAQQASVYGIQPIPHFPLLAPLPSWAREFQRTENGLFIEHAPMFYVPKIFKSLDGMWLRKAIISRVARIQSTTGVDAIDAHFGYPEGLGCVEVGTKLGLPVFITVRGFENEYAERRWVGPKMLEALRQATGCIAVSYFLKEFLLKHGVREERIQVIHNAIDGGVFCFGESESARAKLNLPAGAKLLVSVGHLVSRKRHHVLIEALAVVRRKFPSVILAIIGAESFEPEYPKRLADLVVEYGLGDVVRFIGNISPPQVADWLRAADVFALGTAREGCCNAVLEALAVGTPVVTTPAGDNAYFVKNGQNGMIVGIDDVQGMASAIVDVLNLQWDRIEIARACAAQVGGWNGVAARVLDFFSSKLARA